MKKGIFGNWFLKPLLLTSIHIPIWILGALFVSPYYPINHAEPGLFDETTGLILLSFINTLLIILLINSSKWHGWHLSILLGVAYYGSFTFNTQIETWYFLSDLTVSPELLPRLFLMGLPVPFLFIPLAVITYRKWTKKNTKQSAQYMLMSKQQFILKLAIISFIYLIIYWSAGYFIAWQNPDLRAFYGSEGEIISFWRHTGQTIKNEPGLMALQIIRGCLFAIIAIPVIRGSLKNPWPTAILVALLLAVPHLGHILANPLIPEASVRMSHMLETTSSTFLFGLIIFWLLHREHYSMRDLFSIP